uniref:Uncharacterized protein n=1 Tax=Cacopsylla melanoneura TaxID=428564 RepID=A0A8D8M8P7_9HEMI
MTFMHNDCITRLGWLLVGFFVFSLNQKCVEGVVRVGLGPCQDRALMDKFNLEMALLFSTVLGQMVPAEDPVQPPAHPSRGVPNQMSSTASELHQQHRYCQCIQLGLDKCWVFRDQLLCQRNCHTRLGRSWKASGHAGNSTWDLRQATAVCPEHGLRLLLHCLELQGSAGRSN